MSISIAIRVDRELIRHALAQYFLRRLGKLTIAVTLLLAILFGYEAVSGSWSTTSTVAASIVAALICLVGWIYRLRLHQSETFLSKMKEPIIRMEFSNEGVTTSSDLGTSQLKWEAFDEVLEFPRVWLLVYAKSGYLTIPTDLLSDESRQLIKTHLKIG